MTKKQKILCNAIIHSASAAAASVGAGLAQVPCSDSAIITPIQIAMTVSLGKVFGIKLSKSSARSAMGTGLTTLIGRTASQVLVGWIPVAGNVINAATAASITEALGWIIAGEFAGDTDPAAMLDAPGTDENVEPGLQIAEYTEVENYDGKAKNVRIEAVKEIGKQLRVLQQSFGNRDGESKE